MNELNPSYFLGKIKYLDYSEDPHPLRPSLTRPIFCFGKIFVFMGVLIFCAGNYRVFSWSEICFLMNADLRSSTENLSFTNWRRGRSEGRRFLAGIKWRMDFWCGRICICIFSVFYLCICVYRGIWVTDFECIRSASAGIYLIKLSFVTISFLFS